MFELSLDFDFVNVYMKKEKPEESYLYMLFI